MITGNRQTQAEAAAASMKELRREYRKAKALAQAARKTDGPTLSDEEKRQKALEIAAEMDQKYGANSSAAVTELDGFVPVDVRNGRKASKPAAKGRAGRGGSAENGQKIASSSAAARAPEAAAELKKTKPNRRENEFMLNLMVLRNTLAVNAPACRERAKGAGKWVWRDIQIMLALVNKVQAALIRTMPESRDDYYAAYAMHGHYELHINGPVRTPRMLLVTDKHLASLAEAAMKSECIMCMREGSEVNRCELREALLESAVPTEYQEGKWKKCEYREAAGQLIRGEDATI